jgi:hypothetical protein
MELVVVMARKWYLEGKVPENWKEELMGVNPDQEFMEKALQELLQVDDPWYYSCPTCSCYV